MTKSRNWPTVAFGDVVHLNTDRVADPAAAGIERYVGIEHITPEDLRIRSWGQVAEGTTFTNHFRPGQVLFAKRRAYQHKVALADFEGVCSGDIYVLESKDPDVLLPELLPFICQTDSFFNHAVNTSAGSLSPRTNWSQLAAYEFPLPPPAEQSALLKVFNTLLTVQETLFFSIISAERVYRSLLRQLMSHGVRNEPSLQTYNLVHPKSWPVVSLDSIASIERGKFSHRPRNLSRFYGGPYPFVQTGDVGAARRELTHYSQTLSEDGLQYSRSFPPGTIFITIAAIIGATAITREETWCTDSVVGIVPQETVDVYFLEYVLRYIRPYLENQAATQTAQKNINLQILRPLKVPLPPIDEQKTVVNHLKEAEQALSNLESRLSISKVLLQKEINQHLVFEEL